MKRLTFLCLAICLGWPHMAQGDPDAFFLDYKNGSNTNTGKSWEQAIKDCDVVGDSTDYGDTIVFRPNDTLYDCRNRWPDWSGAGTGHPDTPTVYCDSQYYEDATGSHYSTYGPASNTPVLYGGHDPADDAGVDDPGDAWILHSGNVYKAEWTEVVETAYSSGRVDVCVGIQNHDSMLLCINSLANVNGAGEFFYDDTKDTVYVWMYGGGDPDGTSMIFTRSAVMWHFNQGLKHSEYVLVTGLDMRGGTPGVFFSKDKGHPRYSTLQHCYITRAGNYGGGGTWENGSCVYFMNYPDSDTANGVGAYNTVRACSLGWAQQPRDGGVAPDDGWIHGAAITIYGSVNFTAESLYVFGYSCHGIDLKMDGSSLVSSYRDNVVKYCVVIPDGNDTTNSPTRVAIRLVVRQTNDSIYGNIIAHCEEGIGIEAGGTMIPNGFIDSARIFNNTLYNCAEFLTVRKQDISTCRGGNFIRYNVFQNAWTKSSDLSSTSSYGLTSWSEVDAGCQLIFGAASGDGGLDSNIFFSDVAKGYQAIRFSVYDDYNLAFATWQAEYGGPFDVNSTYDMGTDSVLTDPIDGDFSANANMPTMNRTYGGRTWTVYGAIQGASASSPHPKRTIANRKRIPPP